MSRRGQAAMEFFMTYGWAILIVLVAIGTLAYFGVLSPENFLPHPRPMDIEKYRDCDAINETSVICPIKDGSRVIVTVSALTYEAKVAGPTEPCYFDGYHGDIEEYVVLCDGHAFEVDDTEWGE